ncbi:MAG: hypothetical protein WAV32_07800 [Halobacteriota archaeon]
MNFKVRWCRTARSRGSKGYYLDELKRKLRQFTTLVDIPPIPWGYSCMVALTHDVDITSVNCEREAGFLLGMRFIILSRILILLMV